MKISTFNVLVEIGTNACAVLRALETNDLLCCVLVTGIERHKEAKKKKAGETATGQKMPSRMAVKKGGPSKTPTSNYTADTLEQQSL